MTHTESTRTKIQESMKEHYRSDIRYGLVVRRLTRGAKLHPSDYAFYRRYCKDNGEQPLPASRDSSVEPVSSSVDTCTPLDGKDRYDAIMGLLRGGSAISHSDRGFLWRFCSENGLEFPRLVPSYTLASLVES